MAKNNYPARTKRRDPYTEWIKFVSTPPANDRKAVFKNKERHQSKAKRKKGLSLLLPLSQSI
jgi:hypothetical protein